MRYIDFYVLQTIGRSKVPRLDASATMDVGGEIKKAIRHHGLPAVLNWDSGPQPDRGR
jgi:hypothetical protein